MHYGDSNVWLSVRRAACGVRWAVGGGGWGACGRRQAAGRSSNDGDGNVQVAVACGNVWLVSSCGDSNVIQYPILDFAFFVPGALETVREKKTRLKDDFWLI
jgi:hypothetical protein